MNEKGKKNVKTHDLVSSRLLWQCMKIKNNRLVIVVYYIPVKVDNGKIGMGFEQKLNECFVI